MDDTWLTVMQALAHTGLAMFVITITWLIVHGRGPRHSSEREEHHD